MPDKEDYLFESLDRSRAAIARIVSDMHETVVASREIIEVSRALMHETDRRLMERNGPSCVEPNQAPAKALIESEGGVSVFPLVAS